MSVATFHASFACRSEVHCKSCRFDAGWRARIGAQHGIYDTETPWQCRKDEPVETLPHAPKFMEPTIPRIMHFVWVQGEPPAWAKAIMAFWQRMNPHYQLMLHDESAVAPEHQHIFDTVLTDRTNKNHIVSKADIIRVDVLRQYGGWHIDMDFMPLAPIDEIWHAFQPQDFMCLRHFRGRLCNGFMAATIAARMWEPFYAEWDKPSNPNAWGPYSITPLENLKHLNLAVVPPIGSFFPNAAKEGAPAIKIASDLLTGRTTVGKARRQLSCCGHPPVYAFHIGLGGKQTLDLGQFPPETPPVITKSMKVHHHLRGAMRIAQSALDGFDSVADSYAGLRAQTKDPDRNIMIWGGNFSKAERDAVQANVLYFENGLIQQSHGCLVDAGGFFGDSSIRREKLWDIEPSETEAEAVKAHYRRFPFEWGKGGDPNGPIIIALQHRCDTGCYRHFPSRAATDDSIALAVSLCAKYLPDHPVIVRPHPRYRNQWQERIDQYTSLLRPGWTVSSDGSFYPLLLKASALVTVNSTTAVEAMAVPVPIATLGIGVWTDSHAMLECHEKPERLAGLFDQTPDMGARLRVASAIFKRQIPYNRPDLLVQHPSYIEWLARCQR